MALPLSLCCTANLVLWTGKKIGQVCFSLLRHYNILVFERRSFSFPVWSIPSTVTDMRVGVLQLGVNCHMIPLTWSRGCAAGNVEYRGCGSFFCSISFSNIYDSMNRSMYYGCISVFKIYLQNIENFNYFCNFCREKNCLAPEILFTAQYHST